jgi:hypothetical protein
MQDSKEKVVQLNDVKNGNGGADQRTRVLWV